MNVLICLSACLCVSGGQIFGGVSVVASETGHTSSYMYNMQMRVTLL